MLTKSYFSRNLRKLETTPEIETDSLPQVAEASPPRSMDVAGEGLLYAGFMAGILSETIILAPI